MSDARLGLTPTNWIPTCVSCELETVRIAAHREDDWLVVSVADDGIGLRTTSGRGSGLANVRARMQGLYGSDAWLRLASAAEGGTTATLRLPAGAPPATEST